MLTINNPHTFDIMPETQNKEYKSVWKDESRTLYSQ